MLKKYFFSSALFVVMVVFMTGCVRDKASECNPIDLLLTYEYTYHNVEAGDLIGSEVDKITVFVFDENDIFLSRHTYSGATLPSDYTIKLPLPAGNYSLLSLGGSLDSYLVGGKADIPAGLIVGETILNDFRVVLKHANQITGPPLGVTPSSLFYSLDEVSVENRKQPAQRVGLMKNSSTVVFRIVEKFRTDTKSETASVAMPYTLYCAGTNNILNAENIIPTAEASEMRYNPYSVTEEGNTYDVQMGMMRLIAGYPVDVVMRHAETGKLLIDEDLISLIFAKNSPFLTPSDLDREDMFIIEFEIDNDPDGAGLTITIKVNGWVVSIVEPEFQA